MWKLTQLSPNGVIGCSVNIGPLLFLLLSDVTLGSLPDVPVAWVAFLVYAHSVFGELGMHVSLVWHLCLLDILTRWS